jgi:uncharacterized protein (DUF924 family)
MFRKKAKAFSADHIALKLCNETIEDGFDDLKFLEKTLVIMPLQHYESLDSQNKFKEIADKLHEDCVEVNKRYDLLIP